MPLWLTWLTGCFGIITIVAILDEKAVLPRIVAKRPWWLAVLLFIPLTAGAIGLHRHLRNQDILDDQILLPQADVPPDWPEDLPTVIVGGHIVTFRGPRAVLLRQQGEEIIVMERDRGGLLVSAKFFSPEGEIICELVRNRFHLNDDKVFRMEQTLHHLSVWDKQDRQVLNVEYLNPLIIRLSGKFYLQHGRRINFTENGIRLDGREFLGKNRTKIFIGREGENHPGAIVIE